MIRTVPFAVALAMALASAPASAQRISKLTGARLMSICAGDRARQACEGYISGVADGIEAVQKHMTDQQGHGFAGSTCIPTETTVNQLHSTVVAYLRSHSENLGKPAIVPTFDALHAAFPCNR